MKIEIDVKKKKTPAYHAPTCHNCFHFSNLMLYIATQQTINLTKSKIKNNVLFRSNEQKTRFTFTVRRFLLAGWRLAQSSGFFGKISRNSPGKRVKMVEKREKNVKKHIKSVPGTQPNSPVGNWPFHQPPASISSTYTRWMVKKWKKVKFCLLLTRKHSRHDENLIRLRLRQQNLQWPMEIRNKMIFLNIFEKKINLNQFL